MKILIADDSEDIRILLKQYTRQWGHEATLAQNGVEALEVLERTDIQLVISDWAMPEMTGIELCRAIRERFDMQRYIYVILLTARQDKQDLIIGMEAGADDFIRKPFNKDELRVRIRAGERLLQMEKILAEQNDRLQAAQAEIRSDLQAASNMQRRLLPDTTRQIFAKAGFRFDWLYTPATFLGGDTFNIFRLDETRAGFYIIDVAGHGIPAALKTVMLHQTLSVSAAQTSLLKDEALAEKDGDAVRAPAEVLKELNEAMQDENDAMNYFTMIYGVLDTRDGTVRCSQAGHPLPIILRADGSLSELEGGGVPIGMLPGIEYNETRLELQAGDRLILYTDGVTECENRFGEQYTIERFRQTLAALAAESSENLIYTVQTTLAEWRGSESFGDDLSLFIIERNA
jgi:sigma-B regulation protein RsbU (phosphoserine phosphatase)